MTPRLISPRPSLTGDALAPEEALAILVEMRVRELEPSPFPFQTTRVPDLQECRDSGIGGGNFMPPHSTFWSVAVTLPSSLSLSTGDDVEPFEQAAAAAVAAAIWSSLVNRSEDWNSSPP